MLSDISSAIFGQDGGFDDARKANDANRRLLEAIKLPEYMEFAPELYENETANYELINENPLLKEAQASALAKMAGLAETGLSEVDQAGFEKARSIAGQVQKQGQAAALQNAQARGVGGSGLEFAMKEMANQDAASRAQEAGLQQAADSARQRALYAQAYGQQLAGVRGQDLQAESANKGIINQFNSMNTQNRNAVNNQNVDQRNNAFKYNEGLKDKRFGNEMSKVTGQMGINDKNAQISSAEGAYKQGQIGNLIGLGGAVAGAFSGGGGAAAGKKKMVAGGSYNDPSGIA
jgi:hypothetical protein